MSQTGTLLSKADSPDEDRGDVYLYWCLGCDQHHQIIVGPGLWGFNGDQHNPTVDGSVLVHSHKTLINSDLEGDALTAPENVMDTPLCHSFIRAGRIEYLSDCTHELAGETVPMRPFGGSPLKNPAT